MPSAFGKEELLAQALADFLDRQAHEETPAIEGFCRERPEIADELRPQLETLAEIDRAIGLAGPPPAGHPAKLSGYTILSEIGSGGMGRVFLAMDERLGRRVAIKTLNARYADNPALRARFMHEARAT